MGSQLSWEWPENGGRSGAAVQDGKIVWWHTPGGPMGRFSEVACEQAVADFIAGKPNVPVPEKIILEMKSALAGA